MENHMADVELTGALQGLKLMDISDLQRYKIAVSNGGQMGFAYYFPSLLTHNRPDHSAMLIEQVNGSVCIYRLKYADDVPQLDVFVGPSPMTVGALKHCVERANDYNGNYSARVLKIDAKDHEIIASQPFMRFMAKKSQYLYTPESFSDLSGGAFRTLRRNVAKIQALDDVEIVPYSKAHKNACLELLQRWYAHHRTTYGTNGSVGSTRRFLQLTSSLTSPDLIGEVIYIDGKVVAFSFGGEIRSGYAAFLEAKCDSDIPGLSYFQRYSFISKLSAFALVNDGSDMRRQGLAQLKNSLRPSDMHVEYRGVNFVVYVHPICLS